MTINPVNENTVIIYLADEVTPDVARRVASVIPQIKQSLGQNLVDIVPSYTSVLVSFDLKGMGLREALQLLQSSISTCEGETESSSVKTIELPVYYGEEVGLDLHDICEHTGLSIEEVVQIHSTTSYQVYAIGFAPGFAYLGNTDPRLEIPRKQTPRLKVPKGSLAIADRQTAIYPKQSPGGWQIIGRTPIDLIDFERENLTMFEMGAQVSFKPITREQFLEMGGDLEDQEAQQERRCA
ncbi:5-oxoprolinase subunit PxpB [Vibrio sp. SCSIO 43140]|uniref:5-oxoprolinase subunit PxpB n=1 Tax=Vibrio sp. SCSIO 43140 TaxID=2819100 RepID=UPI002075412E|nr:5-oxoprolinase subunit PxpB [Vibrio sp. SCSIO 43140]USD61676.1 5-oxoprolinase subunit PxpB [Vibrio sp. SCSIO 43140]